MYLMHQPAHTAFLHLMPVHLAVHISLCMHIKALPALQIELDALLVYMEKAGQA